VLAPTLDVLDFVAERAPDAQRDKLKNAILAHYRAVKACTSSRDTRIDHGQMGMAGIASRTGHSSTFRAIALLCQWRRFRCQ
jgi:hypothetical protein